MQAVHASCESLSTFSYSTQISSIGVYFLTPSSPKGLHENEAFW